MVNIHINVHMIDICQHFHHSILFMSIYSQKNDGDILSYIRAYGIFWISPKVASSHLRYAQQVDDTTPSEKKIAQHLGWRRALTTSKTNNVTELPQLCENFMCFFLFCLMKTIKMLLIQWLLQESTFITCFVWFAHVFPTM